MPRDEGRPAGIGTRILTVVVAPFVAAYLGARALSHLTTRLLNRAGAALVAGVGVVGRGVRRLLRGVTGAIRRILHQLARPLGAGGRFAIDLVWRFFVLAASVMQLAVEAARIISPVLGAAVGGVVVLVKAGARAIARPLRAAAELIVELAKRLVVLVKAGARAIARPLRAAAELIVVGLRRAVAAFRAVEHMGAQTLRFAMRGIGLGLRAVLRAIAAGRSWLSPRLTAITRPIEASVRFVAVGVVVIARAILRAIRASWRAIRAAGLLIMALIHRWLTPAIRRAWLGVRGVSAVILFAARRVASDLRLSIRSSGSAIRASVSRAVLGVRVAVSGLRETIRRAFSARTRADRTITIALNQERRSETNVEVDQEVVELPRREARDAARGHR